ncbi:MAG: hypothetical protein JXQ84_06550 [Rhodospirillaceae bacterium]|nr:hypothetical protein [Rhodospirillaceae bacterium]
MAKGQQRSNREAKKPKKTAAPAAPVAAFKGISPFAQNTTPTPKKKG